MRKSSPLQYRAASIGDHEPGHVDRPAAATRRPRLFVPVEARKATPGLDEGPEVVREAKCLKLCCTYDTVRKIETFHPIWIRQSLTLEREASPITLVDLDSIFLLREVRHAKKSSRRSRAFLRI
jgi:hypothetical protein